MKKNFFHLAGLLAAIWLTVCSGGCSTPWGTVRRNIEHSRDLRVGMTKSEVLEIMGEPIRDENFCKPDIWYYYIEMVWGDGLVTEDECMPLVFENGLLVGWGNNFYVSHRLKRKNEKPVLNPEPENPAPQAKDAAPAADAKPTVETTPAADAKPVTETAPATGAKPATAPKTEVKPAAVPEPEVKPAAAPSPAPAAP